MKIRFYNARILTMEDGRDIFGGELWVIEERISFVGEKASKEKPVFNREIDCHNNLLMPGFKNAHTHSGMTLFRSLADDLPLQDWLETKIFPAEAKLTPEDIYEGTRLAILEYLTSGITAIYDMYLTPESIARACIDMGMRCVQGGTVNNFCHSVEELETYYLKYNSFHPLISYRLGFHAEYTCREDILKGIADLSHKYQAPVMMHLAETKKEVEECRKRHHMTPAVFLDSMGMFEYGGGGFHCVHMSKEEIDLFERKGLVVVTNPGSNVKLASGIPPIKEYLDRGIVIGIGTDGPASNNCLDMFREMFLVTGLSKLREENAASIDAMEVLKMATVGGARVMGLSECDVLAEGKLADIIMIDMHKPNMQPENHIAKNIVYSGSKENVTMTMIHGKILYGDGKFDAMTDVNSIYHRTNEIIGRIR